MPVELCQFLNAFIFLLDACHFVHFKLVSVCGGVCCSALVPLVTIERLVTAPRDRLLCSTSLPGGNQVDGVPSAVSMCGKLTRVWGFLFILLFVFNDT